MSSYPNFSFTVTGREAGTRARRGILSTPHGSLETPNFIFCGTKATVKALTIAQLREAGADFILANTYHLMVQPGADLVQKMGGLHKFTGWDGPMLTDSGGFQIFSLGMGFGANEINARRGGTDQKKKSLLKITEEGAAFRSYLDGSKLFLSPESSIDIQRKLGADFILQLDELTTSDASREYTARSMAMSARWGDRSLAEFDRGNEGAQALYGIVQGGVYGDLRAESASGTASRSFFGTAIGGAFGNTRQELYDIVEMCVPHVHPDRPIHLLGIGGIPDVFEGVRKGMDTFDCVSPTRLARHGWALAEGVPENRLNLRNARFREEQGPLDTRCGCYTCQKFSCAYLHHLFRASEITGMVLLSIHNVATMTRLMREVRAGLDTGTLDEAKGRWLA